MALRVVRSANDHAATVAKLEAALDQRGLSVFARFDHAAGAHAVGLELEDELVLVFGDPRAGTPLMQEDRRVGLELPLRVLVWRDGDEVFLGYRDPRDLGGEYSLGEHRETLERMAQLLEALSREAAS